MNKQTWSHPPVYLDIRRNSDGRVVRSPTNEWWAVCDQGDGDPSFIWEEGNYACDCNRSDFFDRAINAEEDDDAPCGHGRFSVRITLIETGAVLYQDGDWDAVALGRKE